MVTPQKIMPLSMVWPHLEYLGRILEKGGGFTIRSLWKIPCEFHPYLLVTHSAQQGDMGYS